MRSRLMITAASLLSLLAGAARGAEVLLETDTSWDGGSIAYPVGEAQVTSVVLHLEPGQDVPFHCHPIPTMGFVKSGALEVETTAGAKAQFKEGDAVVEVMSTPHRGHALGGPVDIIVFYAGAKGVPTTVLPGSKEAETWPCGDAE
jgi:quercetin dioxygenase-like cupin family protein